ncbi:MAG: aminotransferase class I and II [Chloroflexota bacterium]|nr:aminotransferase class I and II [Chloroflexota bacterium]
MLRTVTATRYVIPLREGGSLPAIVEADDDGLYVLKFRGAGQGVKTLIAEVIVGELARSIGLPVPELVLVEVDPSLGRNEPDPEIQELIGRSHGLNLAMDYLPGSMTFNPLVPGSLDPDLASAVVWFDALMTNVDRTVRNPNLLCWHRRLYLIDHGAALYVHHAWHEPGRQARSAFPRTADHVLLPFATGIPAAHDRLAPLVTPATIAVTLSLVPDEWLVEDDDFSSAAGARDAYATFVRQRLEHAHAWVEEAIRAHHGVA